MRKAGTSDLTKCKQIRGVAEWKVPSLQCICKSYLLFVFISLTKFKLIEQKTELSEFLHQVPITVVWGLAHKAEDPHSIVYSIGSGTL